ncbi:MAG TPA: hypothetical protein VH257_08120, partial [Chloroflexota bacterium]|nr:hypothetical protein [Chloroflexota bacterium]
MAEGRGSPFFGTGEDVNDTATGTASPPVAAPSSSLERGADVPRTEHPNPIFRREPWLTLNGRWRFTFDPQDAGEQGRWHRLPHPAARPDQQAERALAGLDFEPGRATRAEDPFRAEIVVPFPWESRLSGVGDTSYKGAAWYQRVIEVPAEWAHPGAPPPMAEEPAGLESAGDAAAGSAAPGAGVRWRLRPYVCFGAVDWSAKVWVNGRFVGEHAGGYTPFALDVSRYVRPGRAATLTVRAWDTSAADTPIGKQVERWYTHSGGIWQPVWLEGRPEAHITRIQITTTSPETGAADFEIGVRRDLDPADEIASAGNGAPPAYTLRVTSDDGAFPDAEAPVTLAGGEAVARLRVEVPRPRLWSPEDPHLYDCVVTLTP